MSLRSEVIRIFNELVGAGKKITELPPATTPLAGTELLEIVQDGANKRITASSLSSVGTGVQSVVAGTNVTVDATDPQNPIVSASGGGTWGSITGTLSDQTDLQAALDAKQAALGFTPENVANKKTDFSVVDNIGYPCTQAVQNLILAREAGLSWKAPVRVATTASGTLATSFENGDTVDGVVLVTGNRILIKDQAVQTENGIYTVNASGAPTRATDADTAAELEGATVTAQEGTSNANTTWNQTTDGITLGSSNIVWTQFGSSVPDASSSVKGIAKLYTSTGSGTDGAMDQNSATNAIALKVAKAGDTMSGNLAMGANKVTGLGAATANGDAVRYEQVTPAVQTAIGAGSIGNILYMYNNFI